MTPLRRTAFALAIAASACDTPRSHADQSIAREMPCDSSRAERVALDSLARLNPFPSAVLRFERDSAGVRLVTWPNRQAGATEVDGMAIVRVTPRCHIASIVQTDSA